MTSAVGRCSVHLRSLLAKTTCCRQMPFWHPKQTNKQKKNVSMTTSHWWQCNFIAKGPNTKRRSERYMFVPFISSLFRFNIKVRLCNLLCFAGLFFSAEHPLCFLWQTFSVCFCSLKVSHEQSGFVQCLVFSFWKYTSVLASRRYF